MRHTTLRSFKPSCSKFLISTLDFFCNRTDSPCHHFLSPLQTVQSPSLCNMSSFVFGSQISSPCCSRKPFVLWTWASTIVKPPVTILPTIDLMVHHTHHGFFLIFPPTISEARVLFSSLLYSLFLFIFSGNLCCSCFFPPVYADANQFLSDL